MQESEIPECPAKLSSKILHLGFRQRALHVTPVETKMKFGASYAVRGIAQSFEGSEGQRMICQAQVPQIGQPRILRQGFETRAMNADVTSHI